MTRKTLSTDKIGVCLITAILLFGGLPVYPKAQDAARLDEPERDLSSAAQHYLGSIKGIVRDYETKKPVARDKLVVLAGRSSTLVLFAGAWNILGRQNELFRWCDSDSGQYMSEHMWEAIPYIGLEFEF